MQVTSRSSGWRASARLAAGCAALGLVFIFTAPGRVRAQGPDFSVLFTFAGGTSGALPYAGLIADPAGNLYGSTGYGGTGNCGSGLVTGCGIDFKLDANGQETVLHEFTGYPNDGSSPEEPLLRDAAGNLYGTTPIGGDGGFGTVFKIDAAGNETMLYSFGGGGDGAIPNAGLLRDALGNLYGTASEGHSAGVVFKISPTGQRRVLYRFTGGTDGGFPVGNLVRDSARNLYGVAMNGGDQDDCLGGCGVVFMLDPANEEFVLHTFTGGADGANPIGVIRDAAGNLYGATVLGGAYNAGTIFKLDPDGNETVLYTFTGGGDGFAPSGGVVADAAGNLYGVTGGGGRYGQGVVFVLRPDGKEEVLHHFTGGADGSSPQTPLLLRGRDIYGVATIGGDPNCYLGAGCGVVYKISR